MILYCLKIAEEAHREQRDKQGHPYIGHVIRVAWHARQKASLNGLSADDVDYITAAAFLHDVLEDTHTTAKALLEQGVPSEVVAMVQTLTRTKDTSLTYQQWIDHICANGSIGAVIVKWADNTDNLNPDRRSGLPAGMDQRYLKAREKLERCLATKGFAAL